MVKKKEKKDLEERKPGETLKNVNWEMFCQIYAGAGEHFGKAVWSYVLAYDTDLTIRKNYGSLSKKEKAIYDTAATCAYQLLRKQEITTRCNEILDLHIKDEIVDRETVWTILQRKELGSKVAAIREYNDVRQRIKHTEEITHKFSGKNYEELIAHKKALYKQAFELRGRNGENSAGDSRGGRRNRKSGRK